MKNAAATGFATLLLGTLVLSGCSKEKPRFEMMERNGVITRLDTKTGEIISIRGEDIYRIDAQKIAEASTNAPSLGKLKNFGPVSFPHANGKVSMKLDCKWRKGSMLYRFNVSPYKEELNKLIRDTNNRLTLSLDDSDGFEVVIFRAPLSELVRHSGADEKASTEWSAEAKIEMSKDDYALIHNWGWKWVFTDELKTALGELK